VNEPVHIVLCGEYNAANSMGGMSGWADFVQVKGDEAQAGVDAYVKDKRLLCSYEQHTFPDVADYTSVLRRLFDAASKVEAGG
jgi:hypothetical protein